MSKNGRERQEVKLGQVIGDFKIVRRDSKMHRPHHRKGEYFYISECLRCGASVSKTMWNYRNYSNHHWLDDKHSREVAYKQSPGVFAQLEKGSE